MRLLPYSSPGPVSKKMQKIPGDHDPSLPQTAVTGNEKREILHHALDPCMVYVPIFSIKINDSCIDKYTSPMDHDQFYG